MDGSSTLPVSTNFMIPLIQLNPEWSGLLRPNSGESILLDCPNCGPKHRLCAYFSNPLDNQPCAPWQNPTWNRIGESFETLTLEPSIQYPCFHGWIEEGQVIDVRESKVHTWSMVDGRPQLVALSPRQVIASGMQCQCQS